MSNDDLRRLKALLASRRWSINTRGITAAQLNAVTRIPTERISTLLLADPGVEEVDEGYFVLGDAPAPRLAPS